MRETCTDCGKSWGVMMTPRTDVLCGECARPKPWRNPGHYWGSRVWNFPYRALDHSVEWWDQRCALQDLKYAASLLP